MASHAQKYFIRLNSMNRKDKRRSSIHDITTPAGGAGAPLSVSCSCNVRDAVLNIWVSMPRQATVELFDHTPQS